MKQVYYVLVLMFCLPSLCLHAQEYKVAVQNTKDGKLILNNFPGDLPVEGYSGSEIIITSDLPANVPERAKGLKPVYGGGTDNTGIAVSADKNGNQVVLQCLLPITKNANYKIKVPDNFSIQIDNSCGNSGDVTVSNVKGELAIKNCGDIKVKNASGPLVFYTISGNINISFASLAKDRSISLASVSGDIDVTVPATTAMDVELKNISGGIYSDFNFPNDDKGLKRVGGNSVASKLNGGGASLKITNVSGNIYLRKG
ncbi:MAG: DUF4097 family beta strand repeat-containing protein [Parafilimonas sp.]